MVQVDRGAHLAAGEWLDANRALWEERVPIQLDDRSALRAGRGLLGPTEEAELAARFPEGWGGKRVLHLQCHGGADSLVLAQRGAAVIGLDFSMPAIRQARALAAELDLADSTRFVCANLYDARHMLPEPDSFDIVFTSWGTVGWLPDVAEWARIVEWFLRPGGTFYFADAHPAARVLEGEDAAPLPAFVHPYESGAEPLRNGRSFEWNHGLGSIITALRDTGLTIDALAEHDRLPWRMYPQLVAAGDGTWTWPDRVWLPLALTITAGKPVR